MKYLIYATSYTDYLKKELTNQNICKIGDDELVFFREIDNGSEAKGYEENDITLLQGTWNICDILTQEKYGTITFTYENFSIVSTKGNIIVGDFGISPIKRSTLALSWAQTAEGKNMLETNGYECKYTYITDAKFQINNLPYFENKTIELNKQ